MVKEKSKTVAKNLSDLGPTRDALAEQEKNKKMSPEDDVEIGGHVLKVGQTLGEGKGKFTIKKILISEDGSIVEFNIENEKGWVGTALLEGIKNEGEIIKTTWKIKETDSNFELNFPNKDYIEPIENEQTELQRTISDVNTQIQKVPEKIEKEDEIAKKHILVKKEDRENEEAIKKIIEILKNNKISEVIVRSGNKKIESEEQEKLIGVEIGNYISTFNQDLDSRMALYLLNVLNKRTPEEIYSKGAKSSIIDVYKEEKEPKEKTKGVRIFLDTGGSWLKVEKDGKTTTIRIDHHGAGQRKPTSGTKMMHEIMDKAGLLKENPEWLKKFVNFVNEFDNLSYLEKTDEKDKTFNENYFKKQWPNSLYSIARNMPFATLLELFKTGKIIDPSIPLTEEQLNGEIGKILITKEEKIYKLDKNKEGEKIVEKIEKTEIPLKEEIGKQKGKVSKVLGALKTAIENNRRNKIETNTTSLGKIILHDFPTIKPKKGKEYVNEIENHLGFIGTKALGYDTYINWDEKNKKFFINSKHPKLSNIVEKLNEADPECALDVRGEMVFGKIKNLTEKQFLRIIRNPDSLKIVKNKDQKINKVEKNNYLSPQEIFDVMEEINDKEELEKQETGEEEKIKEIENQITELMKNMPKKDLKENKDIFEYLYKKDSQTIKEYSKQNLEIIKKVEELQKQLENIKKPVSNEILEEIARKILNLDNLSEEEEKIRKDKINDISKIIEKIANRGVEDKKVEIKQVNPKDILGK